MQAHASALSRQTSLVASIRGVPKTVPKPLTGNAVGTVELHAEHAEVGYISHPAVMDSSMHLSVFLGGSAGRTRVPGKALHLCAMPPACFVTSNLDVLLP